MINSNQKLEFYHLGQSGFKILLNELTKTRTRLSKKPIILQPKITDTPVVNVDKTKNFELINRFMSKSEPTDNVDYSVINKIIQNKGVYIPSSKEVKPIKELTPNHRNKLIELKKDSMITQRKQLDESLNKKSENTDCAYYIANKMPIF
jgi:hypothetical protein